MTDDATTVETTTVDTTAAPVTSEPHWTGFTNEVDIGWAENKGWKSPADIPKALKSTRELEKMFGTLKASPDRMIVMPSDMTNKDEVDAFYSKLGRPADVEGYSFMKNDAFDKEISGKLASVFHEKGIGDEQASAALAAFAEISGDLNKRYDSQVEQLTVQEMEEVQKEWGNAYQQNLLLTSQAAKALNLDTQDLKNLEAALGPKKMAFMLADVGRKMGQAPALGLGDSPSSFIDTPGQAKAKMESFKSDQNKMSALLDESSAGHAAAKAEYQRLQNSAFPS